MTSPLDMVGIATGNVRVTVACLSATDRVRLFGAYVKMMSGHYNSNYKGSGTHFQEWQNTWLEDRFSSTSERFCGNLELFRTSTQKKHSPDLCHYKPSTRVVPLLLGGPFNERMGYISQSEDSNELIFVRVCMTNCGEMYFECFTCLRKGTDLHLLGATYERLLVENLYAGKASARFLCFLGSDACHIGRFATACIQLLTKEHEARLRRIARDAECLADLKKVTDFFNINHQP